MTWHPNLTRPCKPGCICGKHNRSRRHNELIGVSVSRTYKQKKELEKQREDRT